MGLYYFKQYNDQYGHLQGDYLLEKLFAMLKIHIRAMYKSKETGRNKVMHFSSV